MDNHKTSNKDDPWKDIANRAKSTSSKAGPTVQTMVARMDQLWPFSSALGIFDNGCGWGSIISHILEEHGSDIPQIAQLIAGDLSDSMLQAVREKKETNVASTETGSTQNPWTRLSIQNIDAQDLTTIPSSTISHMTAGHLYMLLPNSKLAVLESHRVLCPGGITALTTGKSSQHIDALTSAFESVKPGTNLQLFKEPWNSEEGIKRELEDAGFVDIETHLHGSELKYEDVGEFADMLLLMPVLNDALADFDEDEKVRVREKLVENLTAVSSEKKGRLTGVGITTLARKPK